MLQEEQDRAVVDCLKAAIGVIDLSQNEQLRQDAVAVCNYLENPNFRIVVFAPFNYGKSTLLNAILGNRTLPMDLIPTTGAAIRVKYGEEIQTRILLKDNREIVSAGTEVLKQFAILDSNRTMRSDVAAVEVAFPHPLLARGVELIDLPGTDDREAQDRLVKEQLLTADLVIQVLDSRKLMTLQERENLRDWLSDRGIKTVIFVVNFLNLLEPEEQKQVYTRLRFVAESFRAELPSGMSNLYRVDALPALRARLKGDASAAQTTGLIAFESALQTLVLQQDKSTISLPRIQAIAAQIKQVLVQQAEALNIEIVAAQNKRDRQIQIKQQAQKLLQQGFQASLSDFQGFLYVPKLQEKYQAELAAALQQNQFVTWKNNTFKPEVIKYQQAIEKWLQQASEFFERQISELPPIDFQSKPEVFLPPPPTTSSSSNSGSSSGIIDELSQFVLETITSVVIEGSNLLFGEEKNDKKTEQIDTLYEEQVARAYINAAADYLLQFSDRANKTLKQYEEIATQLTSSSTDTTPTNLSQQHQLQLIHRLLENLDLVIGN